MTKADRKVEDQSAPKVSVLMVTYNHEPYIAQAVESALRQQTTFPVEIVIGEDCSTDNTREVLLNLQQAHPGKIRLLLHKRNIGGPANIAATFAICRGNYVAMLEGDDYWTDPRKLQWQVDSLDAHPHWSSCFHVTRFVYQDCSQEPVLFPLNWTKAEATIDDLFRSNFIGTCSLVFRNRLFGPLPAWHQQIIPGDWAISLLNAEHGPIGFLPKVMADYRIHRHGVWSSASRASQLRETLRMFSFVDHHFQGKYRQQIEEYRHDLVSSLVAEVESLSSRPAIVPSTGNRSPAAEFLRHLMRPLEAVVRRGYTAIGIRKRAA
jgi:hypothetical protein